MTESQIIKGNAVLEVRTSTMAAFNAGRRVIMGQLMGNSCTCPMDKNHPELEAFTKNVLIVITALFDAEEKRLKALFDEQLSAI